MANDVKWIKMMVGMFDGMSFKKIKRAKIGGESFRDKLTAVWFELMDFAGKCNHNGAFVSPSEIPFTDLSDIAIMIDRDEEELKLCMAFFIKEGMITVVDDVYSLSNWAEYQNIEGMEKIRESKRLAQARWRAKQKALPKPPTVEPTVEPTVDSTRCNVDHAEEDIEKDIDIERDKKSVRETTPTLLKRLLPDYIIPETLAEKMGEWITYKMERKEPYKEQGMKSLLRQIENNQMQYGEKAVCDLIDESMANGWKGIIFDRLKQKSVAQRQTNRQYGYNDSIRNRVTDVDNW